MPWIKFIQKPRGNILTELLRITVSRSVDARHVPQWRNQIKDEMNRSFSLVVINQHSMRSCKDNHQPNHTSQEQIHVL